VLARQREFVLRERNIERLRYRWEEALVSISSIPSGSPRLR
jgi:hypothetical protein